MQKKQAVEWLGLKTNRQSFARDRDAAGLQQTVGQRQVARRARSNWSPNNVQRSGRLIKQERMQAAGLAQEYRT